MQNTTGHFSLYKAARVRLNEANAFKSNYFRRFAANLLLLKSQTQ